MSKEKQIEEKHELSTSIYMSGYGLLWKDCDDIAEQLYNAGYRKQVEGEWILKDHALVCSLCEGEILEKTEYSRGCYMGAETIFSKYCPNCGAKMRKEDESNG